VPGSGTLGSPRALGLLQPQHRSRFQGDAPEFDPDDQHTGYMSSSLHWHAWGQIMHYVDLSTTPVLATAGTPTL